MMRNNPGQVVPRAITEVSAKCCEKAGEGVIHSTWEYLRRFHGKVDM